MTTETNRVLAFAAVIAAIGSVAGAPDVAAATARVSSSIGYASAEVDYNGRANAAVEVVDGSAGDKYLAEGAQATKPRDIERQSAGHSDFWIYDAQVTLVFDEDHDGFYSGVDVSFDADTDYFAADVYARLYLSLDGGPWLLYYTTDVFTIFGTSGSDKFYVETDLLDGYPTGYYDMLIELYDHEFHDHVASYGPFESPQLSVLPLEDFTKELGIITPPGPPVSQSSGGGGSMGFVALVGALLLVLRKLLVSHPDRSRRSYSSSARNTVSPPITVSSTRISRIATGSTARGSSDNTTKSARLPASSVPALSSSKPA